VTAGLAEDRDAIRDLTARSCLFIDTGRAEEWAALWTEDGVFDLGGGRIVRGRDELREHAAHLVPGTVHHLATNLVINVDGDTATNEMSMLLTSKGTITLVARVHDVLRRVDGRWLLHHKSYDVDQAP
jgi:uncharacterized protein (TIGR02246 family)